ncbi:MAG TPA: hypothetical protein V6D14_12950 [Coleofasciculaceae cyanobacterium]|jgi:hypothetical protein
MSPNNSQQQVLIPEVATNEMLVETRLMKDTDDSRLKYRREVEEMVVNKHGEISALDLKILEALRIRLGVSLEEAFEIRNDVLSPYREYKKRLTEYRKAFVEAVRRQHLIRNDTRNGLKRLQELLNLNDEDVASLEAQILEKRKGSEGNNVLVLAGIISLILLAGISSWITVSLLSPVRQPALQNPVGSQQTGVRS